MAFKQIPGRRGAVGAGLLPPGLVIVGFNLGKGRPPVLRLTIAATDTLQAGRRVAVLFGDGADLGMARLAPAEVGPRLRALPSGSLLVATPRIPRWIVPGPSVRVPYTTEPDGALTFRIPVQFIGEGLGITERERQAAARAAAE